MKLLGFWKICLGLNAIMALGAYFLLDQGAWYSLVLAMVLMTLNIWAWKKLIHAYLSPSSNTVLILSMGTLKLIGLCIVIYFMLQHLPIDHLSFGLGFFIVAISAACASVRFFENKP